MAIAPKLLKKYMAVPYIADRLVLKGGTAINLFCTDHFPRLSVDLGFNYIGSPERDVMQQEKPILEDIMLDIAKRRRYEIYRNPKNHAGGKKILIYQSVLGNKGRLELDLNYVYRVPLGLVCLGSISLALSSFSALFGLRSNISLASLV